MRFLDTKFLIVAVKFQFLPLLVEVPLQSWVHLILEVIKAFEKIHWHGIEVRHIACNVDLCSFDWE